MKLSKEKHPSGYTIIEGCGRLGAGLAAKLSLEKKDVVAMDRRKETFRKLASSYGGRTVCADVNGISRLENAGIRKADVFITVANRDNVNIMAAQIIKQPYGVHHVVVRVYDAEKLKLLEGSGIEYLCPTELSEKEINRFMDRGD